MCLPPSSRLGFGCLSTTCFEELLKSLSVRQDTLSYLAMSNVHLFGSVPTFACPVPTRPGRRLVDSSNPLPGPLRLRELPAAMAAWHVASVQGRQGERQALLVNEAQVAHVECSLFSRRALVSCAWQRQIAPTCQVLAQIRQQDTVGDTPLHRALAATRYDEEPGYWSRERYDNAKVC